MANDSFKVKKSLNIEPIAGASPTAEGDVTYDSAAHKASLYNGTSASPVVTEAHTATLTNKTLNGNTATNLISGSGTFTLNTSGTATVPNATDTLVGKATTDTFTNKTFDVDGTGNSLTNIANANIKAAAGIVDTKLATIATAGKVSNSATTAASANTASAIVARDGSGNFSAGTITAALTGAASSNLSATANNHGVLVSGSANTATVIAPDSSASKVFKSGGSSADPSWLAYDSAATASVLASKDANANTTVNNLIESYTTTATAAGTTTLTVSSTFQQYFTGSTTQTVTLPAVSSLVTGFSFTITNLSSGLVTVQSSGSNALQAMAANTELVVTCISTSGTGTASWNWKYSPIQNTLGGTGSVTSVTFTGDGTFLSSTPSSAVTTSGTLTAALKTQTAGTFLAGPTSGSAANPTFRALQAPTIQTFTSTGTTAGRIFTITSGSATVGATYTNNSNTYTVLNTISSQTILFASGTSAPQASGTLTKASGTGDSTIAFSASVTYATYTTASGALYIRVRQVGGGGGAGSSGTANWGAATAGADTSFGSNLILTKGGQAGGQSAAPNGGTATLGSGPVGIAFQGGQGGASMYAPVTNDTQSAGGYGGQTPFGGGSSGGDYAGAGQNAVANTGSGGGGAGIGTTAASYTGSGGGAGGFADAIITSPAATYPYAIGAGGTGGTAGSNGYLGGNGAAGYIIVEEYYQ